MQRSALQSTEEDAELTAIARRCDASARVVVERDTWWLIDELGRLHLGHDRLAATRDLVQYLELLERALTDSSRRESSAGLVLLRQTPRTRD